MQALGLTENPARRKLCAHFDPFYTGTVVQLLSVAVHFFGMLHKRVPASDKEKMLSDLLHTYQFNLGAGFVRT